MLHVWIKPAHPVIMWWYYHKQTVNSLTAPSPNLHLALQLPLPLVSPHSCLIEVLTPPSPTPHSCIPPRTGDTVHPAEIWERMMSWMWAREIILPDYIDFFFYILRYPRVCHVSALERFIGKHPPPPAVNHSYLSVCDFRPWSLLYAHSQIGYEHICEWAATCEWIFFFHSPDGLIVFIHVGV